MLKKLLGAVAVVCMLAGFACAEVKKNPVVVMDTSLGSVKIELFEKAAPISVKNFLEYAAAGFYNETIFHRVIPGFMAQGGGFTADRKQKPTRAAIKNEAANGLKNDRGTIAMARTSAPDSATAQFFINVVNNDMLNRPSPDGSGYAVFGKVVEGMDVVDRIVSAKTQNVNMVFQNMPETPILIKSVKTVK
ncbi:MAG: cyclophilin [Geobacteraceae bacterium GWC2_55_20]|nr:MAG: cyclophilin [Geobacteraceae bacterium GWC2_55_20]OGU26667.1 MAG: cyclophilin [Geobacteraceae bacterium GWF2_54_21]HBA73242.1 cyclophilin [Geobacter sp.]HCE68706.1 cyclophilin [Geobacter sp.]